MIDHREQKRIDYARRSKVEATLERLERDNPTRLRDRAVLVFTGVGLLALPFLVYSVVSGLWGSLS